MRSKPTLKAIIPIVTAISLVAATIGGCHLPGRKSRVTARADRYFKAVEYDKAKIEYLNLLRLDQQNVTAFQQLGFIWYEQGDPLCVCAVLQCPVDHLGCGRTSANLTLFAFMIQQQRRSNNYFYPYK